ncbi:YdeI family protein [Pedococcus sp. NPDC057267]|uniref:YdeI/OmpD-associated family protein n=1 Tax=Pedococcus sp. NPDC057267 TaxID=3346077 RepID=UPI003629CA60
MGEPPELLVADAAAWRGWLADHHGTTPCGVWLVLCRPGAAGPTRLVYREALDEALCQGWVDGGLRKRDDATHLVRFTPRRARSPWSARNVGAVERLLAEGRMEPAGLAEVERARADGRWHRAYGGATAVEVPDDLRTALEASPAARATWDVLTPTNRHAVVFHVGEARRADTRARRIRRFVEMLARGETPLPQARRPPQA